MENIENSRLEKELDELINSCQIELEKERNKNITLQVKCDRYEKALKMAECELISLYRKLGFKGSNILKEVSEALSAGDGAKAMKSEHNVSIGGWITYCQECGFPIDPIDECNCENLP